MLHAGCPVPTARAPVAAHVSDEAIDSSARGTDTPQATLRGDLSMDADVYLEAARHRVAFGKA